MRIPVRVGEAWGLVNEQGRVIFPCQLYALGRESEGCAPFSRGASDRYLYAFWDFKEILFPPRFSSLSPLQGGLARAQEPSSSVYGLCDRSGSWVVPAQFDELLLSAEGPMPASVQRRYGLLNRDGSWAVEPRFDGAVPGAQGLFPVRTQGRWGAIDTSGTQRIPFEFEALGQPGARLLSAKQGGRWGFIDLEGRWVIPAQFAEVRTMVEGAAPVRPQDGGGWALLSEGGALLCEPRYEGVALVSGGRAAFMKGARQGYLDLQGQERIPACYYTAEPFVDGRAHVGEGRFIDPEGKVLAEAPLDKLAPGLSPLIYAIFREDRPTLYSLADQAAAFQDPLLKSRPQERPPCLIRRLQLLVLATEAFAPQALRLSIRVAERCLDEGPPMKSLWRRWVQEGHGDAVREAVVEAIVQAPVEKQGPAVWLGFALSEMRELDLSPALDSLLRRVELDAPTGSISHLQPLLDRAAPKGSGPLLRALVEAALTHDKIAEEGLLGSPLPDVEDHELVRELLQRCLGAIPQAQVAKLRAAGGEPSRYMPRLKVLAPLLERAAQLDLAPTMELESHHAWALAQAAVLVDPYSDEPLAWLRSSPALLQRLQGLAIYEPIQRLLSRIEAPSALPLPERLPLDLDGAFALSQTLGLSPADLDLGAPYPEEDISRVAQSLGRLPPELHALLRRHSYVAWIVRPTYMDLEEGGDAHNLPLGVTGTGDLYLLRDDGEIWCAGERIAPSLGAFVAREMVLAWGLKHGEQARVKRYLEGGALD